MQSWKSYLCASAPPALFLTLAACDQVLVAFALAAVAGAAGALARLRARAAMPFELGLLAFFLIGLAISGVRAPPSDAIAWVYLAAGASALATCFTRQPWSFGYAAGQAGELHRVKLFITIHRLFSLMWSAAFLATGTLALLHVTPLFAVALMASCTIATAFGPPHVVKFLLKYTLAEQETCRWKASPFAAPEAPREADEFDVAVVGSGLGGLTAAALLARGGLRVFVAEQHSAPGGYCHSWLRKARVGETSRIFRFDSGVHDITGVRENGSVSGVFDRLGLPIAWTRMRQANWIDGALQTAAPDWRDYARQLGARHPTCADELQRFFQTAKTVFDGLFHAVERTSGVPLGPRSVEAMLEIMQLHPLVPRWMDEPFSKFMDAFSLTPAAREELCRLSGYVSDRREDLTVFDMIPLYGFYFHGGFYPRGGSGVLAEQLVASLLRDGGELALKAPVDEILLEGGAARGLRLASGRVVKARAVISNADLRRTFLELLPSSAIPAAFRKRFEAIEPSNSAFMVHLGLDRRFDIAEIADVEDEDGFKVGLMSPSLADPSAAPAGFATLELVALLPHEEARRWFADADAHDDKMRRRSAAYLEKKRAFADRMIAAAERALPGLSRAIVFRSEASPLTIQRYGWSSAGAIYGSAKTSRWKGSRSPIRDLWLAGAGNHGPGVEAVMIAGAKTAEAILPGVLSPLPVKSVGLVEPAPPVSFPRQDAMHNAET